MSRFIVLASLLLSLFVASNHGAGQEPTAAGSESASTATTIDAASDEAATGMPVLKFFYYDSRSIEWVVSAEPEAFNKHMVANEESARLFQTLTEASVSTGDNSQVRGRMARWIEQERQRFDAGARNTVRFRKAEGIVAYLRAHDFDIHRLVGSLLTRTGASRVELVAVHLVDSAGVSSYKLKVVLPNDEIGIGKQGFNVVHSSPDVTYTGVVYALALALYEVHEIINAEEGDEPREGIELEPLPPPTDLGPATNSAVRPIGGERSILRNPRRFE